MQRARTNNERYFLRIDLYHRILHGFLMFSFLGLAATGLPIKFNQVTWARDLAHSVGGFGTIIFFHKTCAVILTTVFLLHIGAVLRKVLLRGQASVLWGPDSMVPQPQDLVDMARHFAWFFGLGAKPRFERFTYWEKFDYWAVFWGMAVIGGSGFMLWFSGFFARFIPGWLFNIALVIHSEEALLAVCFIFTIHFFNGHLRPDKFPMDPVIFTGRISEHELQEERPLEYERVREGRRVLIETDPPPLWLRNFGWLIGFTVIAIGFTLFALTMWAQ